MRYARSNLIKVKLTSLYTPNFGKDFTNVGFLLLFKQNKAASVCHAIQEGASSLFFISAKNWHP